MLTPVRLTVVLPKEAAPVLPKGPDAVIDRLAGVAKLPATILASISVEIVPALLFGAKSSTMLAVVTPLVVVPASVNVL